MELGDLYVATGRDSLAVATYDQVLRSDSTNLAALASLAELYHQRDDMRSYLNITRRLFANDQAPLEGKLRVFNMLSMDQRLYREHFFQMGDLVTTLSIRHPDHKEVVEHYATHLIYSGEIEQALSYYKRHLNDKPPQLDYYRAVIDLESYLHRLDSVDRYVAEALTLFPGQSDLYLARGHAQTYSTDHARALDSYKEALRHVSTDSLKGAVWGHIGDAYDQLRRTSDEAGSKKYRKQSYKAYDKSLSFYYDNPLVLNNYAYFLSEDPAVTPKQLARALTMAEHAVELTDNNATFLDTYAWVLFRSGKTAEARRVMQQAISFDSSESPELFFHYAEILAALGEKFMAEIYYRKAFEKDYDPAIIEERLKRLKTP